MKDQITYLPDNADRSVAKQKFKITNWPTYNKALINRGSITFWLDDEAIQAWYESATPSSRGRPQRYSDLAITTVLVIKRVFRLTLRAAQGFIDSIFSLMNVPLRCPDYSCVSRRAKSVNISFKTPTRGEIAHLVIDSTGLKVFGHHLIGYNRRVDVVSLTTCVLIIARPLKQSCKAIPDREKGRRQGFLRCGIQLRH